MRKLMFAAAVSTALFTLACSPQDSAVSASSGATQEQLGGSVLHGEDDATTNFDDVYAGHGESQPTATAQASQAVIDAMPEQQRDEYLRQRFAQLRANRGG